MLGRGVGEQDWKQHEAMGGGDDVVIEEATIDSDGGSEGDAESNGEGDGGEGPDGRVHEFVVNTSLSDTRVDAALAARVMTSLVQRAPVALAPRRVPSTSAVVRRDEYNSLNADFKRPRAVE